MLAALDSQRNPEDGLSINPVYFRSSKIYPTRILWIPWCRLGWTATPVNLAISVIPRERDEAAGIGLVALGSRY